MLCNITMAIYLNAPHKHCLYNLAQHTVYMSVNSSGSHIINTTEEKCCTTFCTTHYLRAGHNCPKHCMEHKITLSIPKNTR